MIVGLLRTSETSAIWCDDNLERQTQPASRLEYEGCAPTKTATTLSRTIGKLACFGSRIGLVVSRTCFTTIFNWAVPILNQHLVPAQPPTTPSPRLILDILTHSPASCWGEKIDYIKTLTQQLHALLVDADGLFDAERGFEINQDVIAKGKHCIINISNFEPAYLRYLICDIIILQLLTYRIHNHLKTKRTVICLAFDEADFFVLPAAQAAYPQSLSPITLLGRLGREYGIQFVLGVSALQNVAPYLLTGADYIIALNSVDSQSIWYGQRALGLEDGTERLLPALKPGQCIFREAQGNYPYPFLGQVDLIEPDHSQKEADYGSIPFTTARGLEDCPEIQAALEQRKAECRNTYLRQSRNKQASLILSATERTFLGHMCLNEYEPINRLFMRMGNPSPATQQKIIDRLVELDLIEALQIRISKSPIRLGYPTTAGWNYVNAQPRFKPLRGGLVHTHICRWKQALDMRGGCDECICEFSIPNTTGFSDVATKINGVWRCTEVVVDCTSNICQHVRDCLISSSDIESLTIVTLLKSEHEEIRTKIISNTDLVDLVSRIGFATVGQILKDLYE